MTVLSSYDLIHYVELLPMSIVFLLKSFGNTDVFKDFEMKNYERGVKHCTTCGAIFLTVSQDLESQLHGRFRKRKPTATALFRGYRKRL